MPSPIGHALAGVAVVWGADLARAERSSPRLVAWCAGLAMLPDTDLLFAPDSHRTATHSLAAAVIVFIVAAVVTGKVTARAGIEKARRRARVSSMSAAAICGLAYASHLLLDWLAADRYPPFGIQLLWPFSHRWFISDLDIFRQTARQQFLTAPIIRQNAAALVQELVIMLPIVVILWWARNRSRSAARPRFQ